MAWAPGDLAVCLYSQIGWTSGFDDRPLAGPDGGEFLSVERVGLQNGAPSLWFTKKWPGHDEGFEQCEFRRVPPHVADEEDAETIRLLNGQSVPVEV